MKRSVLYSFARRTSQKSYIYLKAAGSLYGYIDLIRCNEIPPFIYYLQYNKIWLKLYVGIYKIIQYFYT